MNKDFYRQLFASDPQSVFDDEVVLVWVDWREAEDAIVEYVASKLDGVNLVVAIDDADNDHGYIVSISSNGRTLAVDPSAEFDCRHATLNAIDELISTGYQIRFAVATNGGDTVGIAVERLVDWQALRAEHGHVVDEQFCPIRELPDLMNTPGNELDDACRAYADRVGES